MKPGSLHLTLWERFKLPEILPQQAKYEVGRLCVDIRRKCEKKLTKADEKKYKIKVENTPQGQAMNNYDEKHDRGENIYFTGAEMLIIIGNMRKVESEERLPTSERWQNLYKKIMATAKRQEKGEKKEKSKEEKKK